MNTFSRYVRDTLKFRRYLFEGVILMLAVSGIQLILPQFIRTMLDDYIPNKKLHAALLYFLFIVGIFAVRGLLVVRRNHQMLHFGYGFIYDLRSRIMRHLQLLSSRYYDRVPMGDIMTRMLDDIMNVENMTTNAVLNLVTDFVII
ncbi:MAG: ABC transporter ATP-binding protein, partial [Fibrobacterota bacterium]